MYILHSIAVFSLFGLLPIGNSIPLIIDSGAVSAVQVNSEDSLNSDNSIFASSSELASGDSTIDGTALLSSDTASSGPKSTSNGRILTINVVNKLNSDNVSVYVSGLDSKQQLVFLTKGGSFHYPKASSSSLTAVNSDIAIPLGGINATRSLKVPGWLSGGRVWAADGKLDFFVVKSSIGASLVQPSLSNMQDPNAETNYAFAEFDWNSKYGLYADVTFVDFVGMPMGVKILDASGQSVSAIGLPANAVELLCNKLKAQAKQDGRPWDQLCIYTPAGRLIRVISPARYTAMNSSGFDGYFGKYGTYNWQRYSQSPLTIDTQSEAGKVDCSVGADNILTCKGDNRGYSLPSSADIFGCSTGAFAIEAHDNAIHRAVSPRLCAAFNRATLFLPAGNVQPSVPVSDYYTTRPANWYSAFVHHMEPDGRGYAFPYDDVTPTSAKDVSGLINSPNPAALTVMVGGT